MGPALEDCAVQDLGEYFMRKIRLAVLTTAVSLLLVGLLAPPSNAAPKPESVTINLTAVVTEVVLGRPDVPIGDIAPGSIITGSYTYNPKTKDTGQGPEIGIYRHTQSPYGIHLNMGFFIETDPTNVLFDITVINDSNSDSYTVTSHNNVGTEPGPGVQTITWRLGGTALSNDQLTKDAPVLSSWDSNELIVEGREDAFYRIVSHVTQAVKV